MGINFEDQIHTEVLALGQGAQQRVLEFVRSLRNQGTSESDVGLASLAGAISKPDLAAMQTAIEQGCEQVDLNEW